MLKRQIACNGKEWNEEIGHWVAVNRSWAEEKVELDCLDGGQGDGRKGFIGTNRGEREIGG